MDGKTERAIRDQRLSVILDALAEAVTIRAMNNHIVYANQAALERLGFDSVAALRAADPRELMGPYETTDEFGNELAMDDLPSVRLLRGEEPEPLLMRSVNRDSGQESWVLLKATAVRDDAGAIESAVTIIADVTEATRATQRAEFLARRSASFWLRRLTTSRRCVRSPGSPCRGSQTGALSICSTPRASESLLRSRTRSRPNSSWPSACVTTSPSTWTRIRASDACFAQANRRSTRRSPTSYWFRRRSTTSTCGCCARSACARC